MLERILAFFRNLFKREQSKPVETVSKPVTIVADSLTDTEAKILAKIAFLKTRIDPVTLYDLMGPFGLGFGLTDAEIEFAKKHGVVVRESTPTSPAVDKAGFDLNAEQSLRENLLNQDQDYVFTATAPGTRYRIHASRGDSILKVNGKDYNSDFIPVPANRQIPVRVSGTGSNPGKLWVAVQLDL